MVEPEAKTELAVAVAVAIALVNQDYDQIFVESRSENEKPVECKVSNEGWRRRTEITTSRMGVSLTRHA